MQLKRLKIANFRSIRQADIDLGPVTILIGTNNAGKSAILEAIRIALTRRWGQRGTGFTEYDVHLCDGRPDPKVGDPVVIEVELQEEAANEWPEDLHGELEDIIQLDPMSGRASIIMRVSCSWDAAEESFVPRWEFLNVDRNPLAGRGARAVNLQEFFQFLPVFYLEALRDVADEFSSRSQFWGKLLRTVQIPEPLEQKSKRIFDLLNRRLLGADPLLANLATGLSHISRVAAADVPGEADLRLLPLNTWDILSKAEVIYQTEGDKPWLPLARHGQGVQSLSIMFLFKAFVELILKDLYRPESSAVLALEEPETHLHPQAARSLWRHISELPGQKIVTTHSPYFLQHVPFRDIRVVRVGKDGTTVGSLPRQFRAPVPYIPQLDAIVAASAGLITYDRGLNELVLSGSLPQKQYRQLLVAYGDRPDRQAIHAALRKAFDTSQEFISDAELEQLETFARRIRGEIFFACRWLLVEGPSDYHLVHGIAKGLGYDLDEHGVSVIDFQNNGSPEIFAVLARALGYPWLAVVDGDAAGLDYIARIAARSFSADEIARRTYSLPAGHLEQQLVADGLQPELKAILISFGNAAAASFDDATLIATLENDKIGYAAVLAKQCAENPVLAQRMSAPFRNAILSLRGLT
ncbi:AAA family ATPase [Methylocystis sp. L43]|uniref:ATP-dependent nuclease n=1 Tax=unclassified Methylocystis TaxID=2625913 RepID=UPI0018C27477|nr:MULTISPECIES: AAA family ATPase [unclassified Methylocystis]MBG0796645.1 AAA family ATPase [Methylocystis sp. L43]MBG0804636.1 AAA family ATPase [Methylocystis sp. H15]